EDAKSSLSEAFEELKKVELLDERDQARERAEESAREQADMDSIGLMRARLGGPFGAGYATKLPDCSGVRRGGGNAIWGTLNADASGAGLADCRGCEGG